MATLHILANTVQSTIDTSYSIMSNCFFLPGINKWNLRGYVTTAILSSPDPLYGPRSPAAVLAADKMKINFLSFRYDTIASTDVVLICKPSHFPPADGRIAMKRINECYRSSESAVLPRPRFKKGDMKRDSLATAVDSN